MVDSRLPPPARNALSIVQAACKIKRGAALDLIHDGFVRCGKRALTQPHLRLREGDVVEIDYVQQPAKQVANKKKTKKREQFRIVHDDGDLVVVNKPAGLLTVPSPKRERTHLRGQVQRWMENQPQTTDFAPKAICVHRLDRGVSGLLVFAKHDACAKALISQFANRKPERRYAAIVMGEVADQRGRIESYLTTDEQSLNRYSTSRETAGAELAITHYVVRERWRGATLLNVNLETGRRNQIRVHLAEANHPVIGDPRYRPELAQHSAWPHRRIALHAETLGFEHPMTGEPIMYKASWPQEFRELRRRLKRD